MDYLSLGTSCSEWCILVLGMSAAERSLQILWEIQFKFTPCHWGDGELLIPQAPFQASRKIAPRVIHWSV